MADSSTVDTETDDCVVVSFASRYRSVEQIESAQNESDAAHILSLLFHKRYELFNRTIKAPKFIKNGEWINTNEFDIENLIRSKGVYADVFCSEEFTKILDLLQHHAPARQVYSSLQGTARGSVSHSQDEYIPMGTVLEANDKMLCFVSLNESMSNLNAAFSAQQVEQSSTSAHGVQLNETTKSALMDFKNRLFHFLDEIEGRIALLPTRVEEEELDIPSDDDFTAKLLMANMELNQERENMFQRYMEVKATLAQTLPLIRTTQNEILQLLEGGKFLGKKATINSFLSSLSEAVETLRSFEASSMSIAISGETSCGKTTLMGAIIGSACLPTDADANSAIPVRIIADRTVQNPILRIPGKLCFYLNNACSAISDAICNLLSCNMPIDIPVGISSKEAQELYEVLASEGRAKFENDDTTSSDLWFFRFFEVVENTDNIRRCIEKMNGIIRLVYGLQRHGRFIRRLSHVDPLKIYSIYDDSTHLSILPMLPTIYARCSCTDGLPFMGQLSFIDTPGVSETSSGGSAFMKYFQGSAGIVEAIFRKSNRIILMTTPTTRSNPCFTQLRKKASEILPNCVMIVVNKFEPNNLGITREDSLADILKRYRDEYAKENFKRSNVQFMRAKIFHSVEWGKRNIMSVTMGEDGTPGGLKCLVKEHIKLLSEEASRLLLDLYGDTGVKKILAKRTVISDQEFDEDCAQFCTKSNFTMVMLLSVLPTFLRVTISGPQNYITQESSLLAIVTTNLKTRQAMARSRGAKQELLTTLETVVHEIDELLSPALPNCISITKLKQGILTEVRRRTADKVRDILSEKLPALKKSVLAAVTEVESSYPQGVLLNHKLEYTINDEKHYGECPSRVSFDSSESAEIARKKCIDAANRALSGSDIEASVEKERQRIFLEELDKPCKTLIKTLNAAWGQNISEALPDHDGRASLSDLKKSFEDELLTFNELISLTVEPAKVVKVDGSVTPKLTYIWWFWEKRTYYVAFQPIRNFLTQTIEDAFPVNYESIQFSRGEEKMDFAIKKFSSRLESMRDRLAELVVQVKEDFVDDDPEQLEQQIKSIKALQDAHSELTASMRQTIANIDI